MTPHYPSKGGIGWGKGQAIDASLYNKGEFSWTIKHCWEWTPNFWKSHQKVASKGHRFSRGPCEFIWSWLVETIFSFVGLGHRWAWWILTGYEEFPLRYLMRKYNVPYGLEMWTAIKEANNRHIPVVYGDQDIHISSPLLFSSSSLLLQTSLLTLPQTEYL